MNVTVENLAPCKKLVRVDVDEQKVEEAFEKVTKEYQRRASLPGFRPGKAPSAMVARLYESEIAQEAKKQLISETFQAAIKEHKLELVSRPDVEEIQFGRKQVMQYAVTIETAPEFELPDYKGLPARVQARAVTEADVDRALQALRERQMNYTTVDRPAQLGDIAVVNYTGTCEEKPIVQIAPTAKGLTAQKNFWVELGAQSFIPGFGEQLQGAKPGEKRTVTVDFPADFVTPQLAGKRGAYEVEIVEVKEKGLPALDDALAKSYGAENLEQLRVGVRKDLENELKFSRSKSIRSQVIQLLLSRVQCELPESTVGRETKNVVYELVQSSQKRGVPREAIEQQKDQIFNSATQGAKDRVKANFLFRKIAEKEDIKVTREDLERRVLYLAQVSQTPVDKFVKELDKRDGWNEVHEQIINEKVVDLLESNAKLEEVAPGLTV